MPADAASEFNKLMQTGHTSMTTKTAGAFGQGSDQTVSIGISGNGHPSVVVPMLRGSLGTDAVATSYRLLFASGRPVEPHSPPPQRLQTPQEFKRWQWPKLLDCMVAPLGLPKEAINHEVARQLFRAPPAHETQADSDAEELESDSGDHEAPLQGPRGRSRARAPHDEPRHPCEGGHGHPEHGQTRARAL